LPLASPISQSNQESSLVRRSIAVVLALTPLIGVCVACGDDSASSADGVRTIEVTLTDAGCEPASMSAVAGPTTFHVTNDGAAGVTEFEILSGTKILGEVENIAPGLDRKFSLTLEVGSYVTYCPGAKKERGTLEVAESGTGQTGDPVARQAAVDAYLTYVKSEADQLIIDTISFTQAVKAGDVTSAKERFATGRSHYETIEPIAESFGDLDPQIDAREGDVPEAEWTGFHRIERALWVDNSASGLGEFADKLLADVKRLREQINSIELEPAQIANGAVELLNEVSASKITGEEDRYSHTDLFDFDANVLGAKAAFESVKGLLAANDATLGTTIDQRFADVTAALAPFKSGTGFVDYTKLTDADKTSLSQKVDALAEPLSKVAALVLL
jgi:iron uptake system component EfeO